MKLLSSSPGNTEGRIAFSSTLLGAVSIVVLSLTPWLYSPVVGRVTLFGLLGRLGTGDYRLENYDALLGFTRSVMDMYSIVRSFFFVLAVALLLSLVLLALSLLLHRSKKSAPLAYAGFGLSALVSVFFMFEIAGIAEGVEDLSLTRIPSLLLLAAAVFVIIRVVLSKRSQSEKHSSERLS